MYGKINKKNNKITNNSKKVLLDNKIMILNCYLFNSIISFSKFLYNRKFFKKIPLFMIIEKSSLTF